MPTILLGISVVFQFTAALLSLRLIKITGRWQAWTFIAVAMTLMGVIRLVTFHRSVFAGELLPADMTIALTALGISALMLAGVVAIGPMFKKTQMTNDMLLFKQFLIDSAHSAIFCLDEDLRFVDVNDATCKMLGYTRAELLGKSIYDIDSDFPAKTWQEWKTEPPATMESRHKTKNGDTFPVELTVSYFSFKGNENICVFVSDISRRKQAEEELTKLSRAVEASSSSVMILDLNGNIEYVNPHFTVITGYSRDEAIGQHVSLMRSDETPESTFAELWGTVNAGGVWKGELRDRRKDGSLYWDRISVSGVKDALGKITHYIAIQEDVTHEYELSEQLSHQASHDALTGLVNRVEFERRAERLLSTIRQDKTEHALCYMDLDQFKVINDTCGHTAGDELLRQLSTVLQKVVRKRDTLARLGGDEFGVLMEHCTLDHAHRVASVLQKAIHDYHFSWENHAFKVGVSIGLVAITEAFSSLSELLKQADAACYMAKDLGRNRIHVYHREDESLVKRHGEMQWVTRIYQALEEDRFCLYAQTIVSLAGTQDRHYELLLRMKNDDGKLIPPGAFLPAAERYNLVSELDAWVITSTFSSLAAHPEFLGQIHFVSINLSGQSLTKHEFLDFIISELDKSAIEASKICFEITETAAILNLSTAMKFISTLSGIGCRFALDDFGSGLSSFAYLKNLPVDYLKIDGMFVKDIISDRIDHAMVKSINEIGQVMGMQTIAEFVENDEIKTMLTAIGVDYAQGYGIGRPQPFEDLFGGVLAKDIQEEQ